MRVSKKQAAYDQSPMEGQPLYLLVVLCSREEFDRVKLGEELEPIEPWRAVAFDAMVNGLPRVCEGHPQQECNDDCAYRAIDAAIRVRRGY